MARPYKCGCHAFCTGSCIFNFLRELAAGPGEPAPRLGTAHCWVICTVELMLSQWYCRAISTGWGSWLEMSKAVREEAPTRLVEVILRRRCSVSLFPQ